ncbi:hypothetical protein TWF281_003119 [Arthrobotrys megalospora]
MAIGFQNAAEVKDINGGCSGHGQGHITPDESNGYLTAGQRYTIAHRCDRRTRRLGASKMQSPFSITRVLPSELQLQIFSYLEWESHIICARVCTLWRDLIESHGHTFPCKYWDSSYSDNTSPGIHTLLSSHEAQLIIYKEELVSISIHKIVGTDFTRFGPMGDLVCTLDPRKHYLLQLPLFKYAHQPNEGLETFEGFCYGAEHSHNWESAAERFEYDSSSSQTTIKEMLDLIVAMLLRQREIRRWKLMKMRVRYVMVSGGELAIFWGKFIRGVGEQEATVLDN